MNKEHAMVITMMMQYGLLESHLVDIHIPTPREECEIESLDRQQVHKKHRDTLSNEAASEMEKTIAWNKLLEDGEAY